MQDEDDEALERHWALRLRNDEERREGAAKNAWSTLYPSDGEPAALVDYDPDQPSEYGGHDEEFASTETNTNPEGFFE